jgi:hypothetical protein
MLIGLHCPDGFFKMKQMHSRYYIHRAVLLLVLILFFAGNSNGEAVQVSIGAEDSHEAGVAEDSGYYLREARDRLEEAFDSYDEADPASAKKSLEEATVYLHKAAENSSSDKTREEARKLAAEIDKFRNKISQDPYQQENRIARFWHRVSSIIKREADHLVHSYMEISTAGKTLKHLLDAKMHLFNAEHDLFVSRDTDDAEVELSKVLGYLEEARRVAAPDVKRKIELFSEDIQSLRAKITTSGGIWKKDSVINALNQALANLEHAHESATPTTKLRIELIQEELQVLQMDVRRNSIRDDYDASMATIRSIINEL